MDWQPNFSPGLKLIVEFPSIFNNKFNSFFRGFKQNQYIIIDHPTQNNLLVQLDEGMVGMVRYIDTGRACGFMSEVQGFAKRPYPLVFLKYPESIESSNLRKEDRYPVRLDAAFSSQKGSEPGSERFTGEILNLSKNGCLLSSPNPFSIKNTLYLIVPFPEHDVAVDIECEVKNCQKTSDTYHIGLIFSDSLQAVHSTVAAYLEKLKSLRVRA
ncbi:MAG: flagellar brake protein [Deltaproteobacteria bacterium]|nr:flagellar brake protein [Deltaproteobacteria bacterium]MBW2050721.1 flagellar brake protein [Deltaproteobacteria bacterium]MBW2139784.1 flagellar brake protein [Deltaproteobacteria bacterium]MBW2322774.1 flagellar brake protein [Deltaproteobacteria bacterium]